MELKIIIFGAQATGKSALIIQFILGFFPVEFEPSIEDSKKKYLEVDGDACVLNLIEDNENENYGRMMRDRMGDAHGFIIVYDMTNPTSFEAAERLGKQIVYHRANDRDSVPIIIVANKGDLAGEYRVVSIDEGTRLATLFKCKYMETSAKTRTNVDEVFYEIVREVRRHRSAKAYENTANKCLLM